MGGVLGGIIGGSSSVAPPPPPPKEMAPTRIPIGGDVQKSKLINQVSPIYPRLAAQMRIHGTVRLHAIISKDGRVIQLEVVSGPAQLQQAAMDAVRQWRFSPTLLNTVPVEVECVFDVNFNMQ
jgi:protein TonB